MSGLSYVGATPADGRDMESRQHTEDVLTTGLSRAYVQGRVAERITTRATKVYTDAQDETFSPVAYYSAQDALLVPLTAKGLASGVATLDVNGKLPTAQTPVLGAGIAKGPWGPNVAYGGSTQNTPLKIAQWNLGLSGTIGQPFAFINTSILSSGGRPVVEIRIGDAATQTDYAAQTLIAAGFGRSYYNDYQMVTALPADPTLGESADGVQDAFDPSINYVVNAWIFDDMGETVTTTNTSIASASLFFARTAL